MPGTILSDSSREPFKNSRLFSDHVVSKPVLKPMITRELNKLATVRHHSIHHYMTLDDMKTLVFHNKTAADGRIVLGGRTRGLKLLANALKTQAHYEKTRDFVALSTSHLSAHLKFGTISIRETYYAFAEKYGRKCEFIGQLYWCYFFAHLLFYYPDSIEGHTYKNLRWNKSKKCGWMLGNWEKQVSLLLMQEVRELEQTGYMHNRARLIAANFFSKTLGLNWKIVIHFARHLTDYDVASNNGNWQTISSTGVYHQAYFRDVNPWIQTRKLDYDWSRY
jgi:deoxyribodipyrimidine photo-lyase